jgi:hypothetical protein
MSETNRPPLKPVMLSEKSRVLVPLPVAEGKGAVVAGYHRDGWGLVAPWCFDTALDGF